MKCKSKQKRKIDSKEAIIGLALNSIAFLVKGDHKQKANDPSIKEEKDFTKKDKKWIRKIKGKKLTLKDLI